ncbi:MAG: MAPEG family protein [bacterium]
MNAPITALFAGLLGIGYLLLAGMVIRHRLTKKIGIGDGGDSAIRRAIRVHANASEYVPIALILLFLCEVNQSFSTAMLYVMGGILLVGRIMHAFGLSRSAGTSFGRFYGSVLTFTVIAVGAFGSIVSFFLIS